MKIKIAILLLLILPQKVLTQAKFHFGTEIGLSVTSAQTNPYLTSLSLYSEYQVVSPLLGMVGLMEVTKQLHIKSGFQYNKVGYRFKSQKFGEEKELIYYKLCIPLIIEIPFKISKIKLSVFTGYRPNFLLSGKWDNYNTIINPFETGYPINRYTDQFIVGLSTYIGKNTGIAVSYYGGKEITCGYSYTITRHWPGQTTTHYYLYSLKNNEVALSLTYLFN